MVEASRGACLVVGVGDGVGGAISRAFAAEGYTVCMGEIRDVIDAVLYLEGAGFVTGEILHVDGGQSAGH